MKILLINPLASTSFLRRHGGDSQLPLGICYIAAMLKVNGYTVRILDNEISKLSDKDFVELLIDFMPDVVGITFYTAKYHDVIATAKLVKWKLPKTLVAVGGPHIMMEPVKTLKDNVVFDFAIDGEGEYAFLDAIKKLDANETFGLTRGIVYRYGDEIKYNGKSEIISNLDELPLPAIDIVPGFKNARSTFAYKRLPSTSIITSRGCPYECIFCFNAFGKKYRSRSAENIVDEMEMLVNKYGFQDIFIADDLFFLDHIRVRRICELIIEKKLDFAWSCNIRVNIIYKHLEILPLLKQAGCWRVTFGIESASEQTLKLMKKVINLNEVKVVVNELHKVGFFIHSGFILGFPGETKEDVENTISFAKSLPIDGVQFSIATPFPGTELYNIADKYGVFHHTDFGNMTTYTKDIMYTTHEFDKEYLIERQKKAYKEYYFRPIYVLRQLRFIRDLDMLRKYLWAAYSHFKTYF